MYVCGNRCPGTPKEGARFPWVRVIGSCELPKVAAESQTQALGKTNMCSWLLSHPPVAQIIFKRHNYPFIRYDVRASWSSLAGPCPKRPSHCLLWRSPVEESSSPWFLLAPSWWKCSTKLYHECEISCAVVTPRYHMSLKGWTMISVPSFSADIRGEGKEVESHLMEACWH